MPELKVIVASIDDKISIRRSLVRLLGSSCIQAQLYASGLESLESSKAEDIWCVVADLRMPGMKGQQLQDELLRRHPYLPIIFITGYADVPTALAAMRPGAAKFLETSIRLSAVLDAIDHAVEHRNAARSAVTDLENLKSRYVTLTPRERQVFSLVSAGLLNKQIAAELGAAEKTIKQHRGVVMRKMQAESLAALVLMADRLGACPNSDFAVARGKLIRSRKNDQVSVENRGVLSSRISRRSYGQHVSYCNDVRGNNPPP